VSRIAWKYPLSYYTNDRVQGGLQFEFTSTAEEGALLVLPHGVERSHLLNTYVFQKEALRSGKAWLEFALRRLGHLFTLDSVYLVTGHHKCTSWSLVTFQNAKGSSDISARFTAGSIVGGSIRAAYSWETTSDVSYQTGPEPYEGKNNQTIFICGLRVTARGKLLAPLIGSVGSRLASLCPLPAMMPLKQRIKTIIIGLGKKVPDDDNNEVANKVSSISRSQTTTYTGQGIQPCFIGQLDVSR
jgi:hypothetical protein